jgi:hypothetical protein
LQLDSQLFELDDIVLGELVVRERTFRVSQAVEAGIDPACASFPTGWLWLALEIPRHAGAREVDGSEWPESIEEAAAAAGEYVEVYTIALDADGGPMPEDAELLAWSVDPGVSLDALLPFDGALMFTSPLVEALGSADDEFALEEETYTEEKFAGGAVAGAALFVGAWQWSRWREARLLSFNDRTPSRAAR